MKRNNSRTDKIIQGVAKWYTVTHIKSPIAVYLSRICELSKMSKLIRPGWMTANINSSTDSILTRCINYLSVWWLVKYWPSNYHIITMIQFIKIYIGPQRCPNAVVSQKGGWMNIVTSSIMSVQSTMLRIGARTRHRFLLVNHLIAWIGQASHLYWQLSIPNL